jgi:hypothetical protein
MAVLPKVHPAFGYPDPKEIAVFNEADQAIQKALRTLDKSGVLLSYGRFGFAEGLSIPVLLLGNLKREDIAWAPSADALVIVELPGKIILSSGTANPVPPAPPQPLLKNPPSSQGIRTEGLNAHEETVTACNVLLKVTAKGSDAKDREKMIRENTGHMEPTGNIKISTLVPGRSIGQQGVLMKGTFGIYVTTDGTLP